MNAERAMDEAAGGEWRVVALQKDVWQAKMPVWVASQDLPWASLEQLALEL